jgi:hypothetical protein
MGCFAPYHTINIDAPAQWPMGCFARVIPSELRLESRGPLCPHHIISTDVLWYYTPVLRLVKSQETRDWISRALFAYLRRRYRRPVTGRTSGGALTSVENRGMTR